MKIKHFFVQSNLPENMVALREMALNLWYSWNWDFVKLFIQLDAELWEKCHQNPIKMLAVLPQEKLEDASNDNYFLENLRKVHERYKLYLEQEKWFDKNYKKYKNNPIAYFSLEYGLDTGLPVYSGGLGILSGDTLKSASDLGIPIVAVGLLYKYGYFRQSLSSDGWQQERYEENDWYHMPIQPVMDNNERPLKITVKIDNSSVILQVWKVSVGIISLYLLDSNLQENSEQDREITSILYGGDKDMRIRQEIILGIGGVKALKAMNIEPSVYHMNEGHAWFLTIERLNYLIFDNELSFKEAIQYIWATSIFTTHTPVSAGNERFEPKLMKKYLSGIVESLGISWEDFISNGRIDEDNHSETFCMTVAALKNSRYANGVSKLHGKVSREMWHNIWSSLPKTEVPIKSITNGVHPPSWISHDIYDLLKDFESIDNWENVESIPDADIWRAHNKRRERLIYFTRNKLKLQLNKRGATQLELHYAEQILNSQVMTIGFSRRFSTYKRGQLIFSNPERLDKIINNPDMPVQIIFAGKAHPLDNPGKEIIKNIVHFSKDERFKGKIIFLEDYDINVARYMVQGCDVWLNTPRRPQEASGTSGMKAALNGVVNLSILDGWWDEAYDENCGFKIGDGEEFENVELQDQLESEYLYTTLEKEVIPQFYYLNEIGLPDKWIEKMKKSIIMAGKGFSSNRMLTDYTEKFYLPAIESSIKLSKDNHNLTRDISKWVDNINNNWDKVRITELIIPDLDPNLLVGHKIHVTIKLNPGNLSPDNLSIEIISGRIDSHEEFNDFYITVPDLVSSNNNEFTYKAEIICRDTGNFGITARILPKNHNFDNYIMPKLITWW